MVHFQINLDNTTPFPHYWEMCVGSCQAYTALREDYRQQLKRAHDELGFQYVRFHGLLCDQMSILVMKKDHAGNELGLVYNFVNMDNIFDWLLDNGMKPFIELGFMPSAIASGDRTVFHYKGNITPPKEYSAWETLIHRLTVHLIERYGLEEVRTWFFEVWNEPNLFFFFSGDKNEYFKLYESTARTIKRIDSQLKVGGPATSCNSWVKDTVDYCRENNVALDFISTHHYPTDDPLWASGMEIMEFFQSGLADKRTYHRGILQKMTQKVKEEAGDLPVYFTEWNTSAMTNDDTHDEPYAAALIAKTLVDNDGLVEGYSYWTFSDIFEESAQLPGAYHGGFGLQTYAGIAKPAYRLFQLFHGLGTERVHVSRTMAAEVSLEKEGQVENEGSLEQEDCCVEMIVTKTKDGYRMIAYNHNIIGEPITDESVVIHLEDLGEINEIHLQRIDEAHANAKVQWTQMGQPEYLSREQVTRLHEASELNEELMEVKNEVRFTIPPYGIVAIDLRCSFD